MAQLSRPPRILFLFSDTGGGHRSVCEAVIEAVQSEFGGVIETEMVDFLRDYYPWPFNKLPEIYREAVKFPAAYGKFWHTINTPQRTRALLDLGRFSAQLCRQFAQMLADYQADLVVLTHYMALPPLDWMAVENRPKTTMIVTDLVSTHATWFRNVIDHYIVPTPAARDHALAHGIDAHKIDLIGLPVADRFAQHNESKATLRSDFGWHLEKPIVLLMGGGEGMGPLFTNAHAIAHTGLDLELVVIAGRNHKLRAKLESQTWANKMHVYGFVHEMHRFMQAADVLVTKAGPSSICEGLNAGLPIVLYDRLPGQEEGNVTYLLEGGAGHYAPQPQQVVEILGEWLGNSAEFQRITHNATQLAQPDAARQIAHRLIEVAGLQPRNLQPFIK
ncbi:MAG TPA: glycosyltransferase [Anaerolineae bacterium]|nr:glycosyltransferase [Anaerolineae bacterium]